MVTFHRSFFFNDKAEEKDEWIRLLNKLSWLKMQVMLTFFAVTNLIFICKLSKHFFFISMLRFEWYILYMNNMNDISSSYDWCDKCWFIMWCSREGASTLLNCVWLYLKVVQIQQTWTLWVSTFKSWNYMKLNLLRKI